MFGVSWRAGFVGGIIWGVWAGDQRVAFGRQARFEGLSKGFRGNRSRMFYKVCVN